MEDWVAAKELNLIYYIGETILVAIYIYTLYGNNSELPYWGNHIDYYIYPLW